MRVRSGDIWLMTRLLWFCSGLFFPVSRWLIFTFLAPWVPLGRRYQLGGIFVSACLSSIIVNDWVYSHTPKWLSWPVIFADNDGTGLVRICLRLSIHLGGFLGSFAYAAGHQRAEPDRRSCTFSIGRLGLKWPCIICVTYKWKTSLPRLLSISKELELF